MMVQEQMTHGPATGDGLVFSFVGEDMHPVCVLSGELTWALSIASAAWGALLSIREINWPQSGQDPSLDTWL